MRVIFLDIDGVLNDHTFNEAAGSSTLLPHCVEELNRVLRATDAKVVLSSAWRYMIMYGEMTLRGFEYLLQTHGVEVQDRIIARTRKDIDAEEPRAYQVDYWLKMAPADLQQYVVVDDLDLGFERMGIPFVQTDGKVGLTRANGDRLIEILTSER